nr:hypothetical protein [Tanacetum cinerariifolium]
MALTSSHSKRFFNVKLKPLANLSLELDNYGVNGKPRKKKPLKPIDLEILHLLRVIMGPPFELLKSITSSPNDKSSTKKRSGNAVLADEGSNTKRQQIKEIGMLFVREDICINDMSLRGLGAITWHSRQVDVSLAKPHTTAPLVTLAKSDAKNLVCSKRRFWVFFG